MFVSRFNTYSPTSFQVIFCVCLFTDLLICPLCCLCSPHAISCPWSPVSELISSPSPLLGTTDPGIVSGTDSCLLRNHAATSSCLQQDCTHTVLSCLLLATGKHSNTSHINIVPITNYNFQKLLNFTPCGLI